MVADEHGDPARPWGRLRDELVRRPEMGSFLGLLAVFVFFSVFGGANFLSAGGAASWLNVAGGLGIVALPVGLLMIAGHLDLSVGSVIPASSMTIAIVSGTFGLPTVAGIAAALGLGLLVEVHAGETVPPGPQRRRQVQAHQDAEASDRGIATVHQFGGTFPLMSIGRCFFVGREPVERWGPLRAYDRKTANRSR